jgi:hypothetical protein|tara:strand:- start:401 stop:751 length:351 start_codon:yes stop_codon:yes gene_type:complete
MIDLDDFDQTTVNFDEKTGNLKISGISMMEDSLGFYAETKNKIDTFFSNHSSSITVEFELTYFNSSSAKQFIQILSRLENNKGNVLWKFPKDNTIMEDRGKELEILLDVPFKFIPF